MDEENVSSVYNTTTPPMQTQIGGELLAQVLAWIFFAVIVFVNVLLITVLCKRKRKPSRVHFFILNLALADLGVGLITCFGDAMERTVGTWYAGDVMCKIYKFVTMIVQVASNNLVVAMSIDRFLAVRFPMKFMRAGKKLDKAMVIVSWFTSLGLSAIFLVYSTDENRNCDIRMPVEYIKPYFWTCFLIIFLIPFLLILGCYIGITYIIWKKYRSGIYAGGSGSLTAKPTDAKVEEMKPMAEGKSSNVSGGLLPKAKIRSVKMTLAICLAFVFCWGPYFILNFLMMHGDIQDPAGYLYRIVQVLYAFNSVANPVIFILFNLKMFRIRIFIQSDKDFDESTENGTTTKSTTIRKTMRTSSSM